MYAIGVVDEHPMIDTEDDMRGELIALFCNDPCSSRSVVPCYITKACYRHLMLVGLELFLAIIIQYDYYCTVCTIVVLQSFHIILCARLSLLSYFYC